MNFWQQLFIALIAVFGTVTGPILGYMWKNRQAGKKDSDEKHAQNQQKIDLVIQDLSYFPLHEHLEKDGHLFVDGIRLAPRRNGNK